MSRQKQEFLVPDRVEIFPAPDKKSRVNGIDGRFYVIHSPALIAKNSSREKVESPIDWGHKTESDLAAPAAGWMSDFRAEANGAITAADLQK